MPGIDESKCVLVTGATSGIGGALARAIANLPSRPQVVAAGRRNDRLQQLAKENFETVQVDLDADKDSLKKFVADLLQKYPDLDTVVLCAGIQHEFDLREGMDIDKLTREVYINYTSVVTMISFITPHFLRLAQAHSRPCFIIPVTSALSIVPGAAVPNYSATKAALHSFSLSLRVQLQGTDVHVLEVIPPLVESELHDPYGTTEKLSKFWMPLDEYTKVTMEGLRRGDPHVACGMADQLFKRFDMRKGEFAEGFHNNMKAAVLMEG